MRQLFRVLMLSVVLLLAQQGAVMHELAHAVGQVSSDRDPDHRDDAAPCAGCVAFSHVVANACQAHVGLALDDTLGFVPPAATRGSNATPDRLPPRSRGPPIAL